MSTTKDKLLKELPFFQETIDKFSKGEITVSEFKKISGGFGVYAHRDKKNFMVRLRISCGVISLNDLEQVCALAKSYGLEKIHITTRQAIQFHDLNAKEVVNLIKEALDINITTRGSGGNYPRNVAMSPLSSVDSNEAFDVTPYALAADHYFMEKITEYNLPRKLKVSFSNSPEDTAHATVQDLGFIATSNGEDNTFNMYIGGGLGRNPAKGIKYPHLVHGKDILYHIEALTELFIHQGDYENKGRARIRYIVDRLGSEEFLKTYEQYLMKVRASKKLDLILKDNTFEKQGIETCYSHGRLVAQKQHGLYSVYLHPIGGQLYLKDVDKLFSFLKTVSCLELRIAMTEGIYFLNLNGKEAEKLLELTSNMGGENLLEQSISCIGVPVCQMGILESQSLLNNIVRFFRDKNYTKNILPRIYISGCPNSCGLHEIGSIGLCGKKKNIDGTIRDVCELFIGGTPKEGCTTLGSSYGDILIQDLPQMLYDIASDIEKLEITFEDYIKEHTDNFCHIISKYIK